MSYKTDLQSNNIDLQAILNTINELPDASNGSSLPTLSNPATETETFEGYEFIDATGTKKTGTFTVETEATELESILDELLTAVDSKASGAVETCTVTINSNMFNFGYTNGDQEYLEAADDGNHLNVAKENVIEVVRGSILWTFGDTITYTGGIERAVGDDYELHLLLINGDGTITVN
jgi:hypothetical protein